MNITQHKKVRQGYGKKKASLSEVFFLPTVLALLGYFVKMLFKKI